MFVAVGVAELNSGQNVLKLVLKRLICFGSKRWRVECDGEIGGGLFHNAAYRTGACERATHEPHIACLERYFPSGGGRD